MIRIDPAQLENSEIKDVLKYLIAKYSPAREQRLRDYYEGRHDILERRMADPTKPNNKLVNNLAAFITDTVTGYFMGQPVVYSADGEGNDGYVETLKDIFDYNDEQDHNAELSKGQSIAGVDYELLYLDEEARIRLTELPTENVIYVESDDIDEKPLMAVRIYETDDIKQPDQKLYYYEVYTDSEIITYTAQRHNENVSLTEVDRQPHYFGEVPVVAYPNNKEQMGDFEGVLTEQDEYNQAQSDTANDFEYFTQAYLLMTGVRIDPKDETAMRLKVLRL